MDEIRYQVFIRSTFKYLSEERKSIIEAMIDLDCFPSGMELLPASNNKQFEHIKSIIDESDYYILIFSDEYGLGSDSRIRYTEMEYDYAKEKGIPILIFFKRGIDSLAEDKKDSFNEFKRKISKDKMIEYWNDSNELKYKVYGSLSKAISNKIESKKILDCKVDYISKKILSKHLKAFKKLGRYKSN